MILLHICPQTDWEISKPTGEYRAASLQTEGFIHCSLPAQTVDTARRYFHGQQGLVLLMIDSARTTAEIRFEAANAGQEFPHLYGPLNTEAVVRVIPFPPNADGSFSLPAL